MTPKLPEPDIVVEDTGTAWAYATNRSVPGSHYYTADQMREMWRQGMERAAEICDENAVAIENEGGDAIRKEITP